jgi:hypothetical protein
MEPEINMAEQAKRIADSLEKLANEQPMIEIEPAPPQCPNCGDINPTIIIDEELDKEPHPIVEFVLIGICNRCRQRFVGVVNHWVLHATNESAIENVNYIKNRNGKINAI